MWTESHAGREYLRQHGRDHRLADSCLEAAAPPVDQDTPSETVSMPLLRGTELIYRF